MGAEPVLAQPEPSALNATATAGLLALSAVILGLEELCGGALARLDGLLGLGMALRALAGLDWFICC